MEAFYDIIGGDMPVLVNFHATWCGPCKAMAPVVEALGAEVQGKARILKVDIDKNEELAEKYQVQVVPTFILFRKGEILWKYSGVTDKMTLSAQLKSVTG